MKLRDLVELIMIANNNKLPRLPTVLAPEKQYEYKRSKCGFYRHQKPFSELYDIILQSLTTFLLRVLFDDILFFLIENIGLSVIS